MTTNEIEPLCSEDSGKREWSKNEERMHVVLFSLLYPAVLGTFFFTLLPEIAMVVTGTWDFSRWSSGKVWIAILLVLHFVLDYVYTAEVPKYNRSIFTLDLLLLVSFFVSYQAVNLDSPSSLDIKTAAGAMGITYLLFRLWAHRVGRAVLEDRRLNNYEFASAFWFVGVMIVAMGPTLHRVSVWLLAIGLIVSAGAMYTIAPRTLQEIERESGPESDT